MGTLPPTPAKSSPTTTYNASRHCSRISFTVTLTSPLYAQDVVACNCSICTRNGYLDLYVKNEDLKFISGEGHATAHFQLQKRVRHEFCPTCGTCLFGVPVAENFFPGMRAVNVRAFKGIDIDSPKLKVHDGKSKVS
ncbi:Mss4-like protein [Pterulicium gracile]|uniref:Mss4-like protein n=1 Tax=Pterulicium gracile TaxID=1884261 RepID=A0A5C3Q4E2_9AGAR|nr:Mss4-like protein [Pterula gracilis]